MESDGLHGGAGELFGQGGKRDDKDGGGVDKQPCAVGGACAQPCGGGEGGGKQPCEQGATACEVEGVVDLAAHHFLLGGAGKDKGDDGVEQIDDEQGEQELFVPCEPLALLMLGGVENGAGVVLQQGDKVVQRGKQDGGKGEGGEAEA